MLRLQREASQRQVHRFMGRAQNVYRVDLHGINEADRPGDAAVGDEVLVDFLAFLREELLGIV
jgi:hypothetical protein